MPENSGMMHCGILFSIPYSQHIATKLDGTGKRFSTHTLEIRWIYWGLQYKSDKRHATWNCGIMLTFCHISIGFGV